MPMMSSTPSPGKLPSPPLNLVRSTLANISVEVCQRMPKKTEMTKSLRYCMRARRLSALTFRTTRTVCANRCARVHTGSGAIVVIAQPPCTVTRLAARDHIHLVKSASTTTQKACTPSSNPACLIGMRPT